VHANRAAFDEDFGPAISPGDRLEFSNGLKSPAELLRSIPGAFAGVLDLTLCNSVLLADEIKRQRRFTCLANVHETDLSLRVELYHAVINVISESAYPYVEAVRDVRIAVLESLKNKAAA